MVLTPLRVTGRRVIRVEYLAAMSSSRIDVVTLFVRSSVRNLIFSFFPK